MKKCVKCGNEVNEQDRFCMNCGSAEFETQQEQTTVLSQEFQQSVYNNQESVASEQTTVLQENFQPDTQPVPQQQAYQPYIAQQMQQSTQQQFATQPNQQNLYQNMTNPYGQSNPNFQQSFQPQIQPVKKNPLKKVLIGVGCFLLVGFILGILGAVIGSGDTSDDYNSGKDYEVTDGVNSDDISNNKIAYTKGSVVDDYYINEWAGFKFKITEEWPDTTATARSTYEDETTDAGFISADTLTGKQFVIDFVDLSKTYVEYTEEKFLKEIVSTSESELAGIEYTLSEFYDYEIAGETYECVDFTMENGFNLTYCVRLYDDRIITIFSSSYSKEKVQEAFDSIEALDAETIENVE